MLKPLLVTLALLQTTTPAPAASPVPTVVLFPRMASSSDDNASLSDVRKALRRNGNVDVLTFDPEGAAFKRAARDAARPDWLTSPLNEQARASVTRGVGAQFYATVGRGEKGRADIRLVNAGGSGYAWTLSGEKADDAARHLETDMAGAVDYEQVLAGQQSPPAPSPPAVASVPSPRITVTVIPSHSPLSDTTSSAPRPNIIVPENAIPSVTPPAPAAPAAVSPPPSGPLPSAQSPTLLPPPKLGGPGGPALPTPTATAPTPVPHVTVTVQTPIPDHPASTPEPLEKHSGSTQERSRNVVGTRSVRSQNVVSTKSPPLMAPSAPPALAVPTPTAGIPVPTQTSPEDARTAADAMSRGDDALSRSDPYGAIAAFREAVNATPLSAAPRLKLARAYLKAGLQSRALDEGRRALTVAPADENVSRFLAELDTQTGTNDGAVARAAALTVQSPTDAAAHMTLADALWNNGQADDAEREYKTAAALAPADPAPPAHLARLYAAQARFDECRALLGPLGRAGYAVALSIASTRADVLASTLDTARGQFDAGKTTHEAFYKTVNDAAAQAQGLAAFVEKLPPPPAFALSHAHRILGAQLLAQQAAVLVSYVETSSGTQAQRASELEKASQTEMLTAHAAETKLGLWNAALSADN